MSCAKTLSVFAVMVTVMAVAGMAWATTLNVPNGSFESSSGVQSPPLPDWQMIVNGATGFQSAPGGAAVSYASWGNTANGGGMSASNGTEFAYIWPGQEYTAATAPNPPTITPGFSVGWETTGITDTTIAGNTYTATMDVMESQESKYKGGTTPQFTLYLMSGSTVLASTTLPAGTLGWGSGWTR